MTPLEKVIKIIIKVTDPERIILFGSRAKNENNESSDYDLLILKKGIIKKRKISREIYRNFLNIGAPFDILVSDPDEFELNKKNPYLIYSDIAKYGKTVYEKL